MKSKNLFWGIFFLALAVFTIASQLGGFGQIGVWSVLEGVLLLALIVYSLIKLNFLGVFVPVAFLYMIFRSPLGLPFVSPWLLVLAGVLTSIGFSIIFHKKPKNQTCWKEHGEWDKDGWNKDGHAQTIEMIDDNHPSAKVSFGSSSKYLHADSLQSGQFTCSFGSLEVFFEKTQLSPEGAEIFVDCSFGELKLYVPGTWRVVDKINSSLGGINYSNAPKTLAADAPRLTLTGNVHLGAIEIQYI